MPDRFSILFFPGIIFCAWIFVILFRLVPVGGMWGDLDGSTWLIILVWNFVYFSSMFVGVLDFSRNINRTKANINALNRLKSWVTKLSYISAFGALFIIYEFAFVRGYGFSQPVSSIRILEVNAAREGFGGSLISGIGRLMTPALMTAWVIATLTWKNLNKKSKYFLLIASLFVFVQQYMFEGGRFYYAALLIMILSATKFSIVREKTYTKTSKKRTFYVLIALVTVIGFGYVFVNRFRVAGRDFYEAYTVWASIFDLEQDYDAFYTRLNSENSELWLGIMMLWTYITQGFNELNVLLLSGEHHYAWGSFQFSQIGQALAKIFGADLRFNRYENLPHTGTYLTLYGASFIDFGHIGALLFCGILGWLTGKSVKLLRAGVYNGLSINAPLLIVLGIFAPVISLVGNLWPAFFWALFIHFFRFRLLPIFLSDNFHRIAHNKPKLHF